MGEVVGGVVGRVVGMVGGVVGRPEPKKTADCSTVSVINMMWKFRLPILVALLIGFV